MPPSPTLLPKIPQSRLDLPEINWSGIPLDQRKRFLNPGEAEVLIALVRSINPQCMWEIGVNEGRTARLFLDNVESLESYIGFDVLPGYMTSRQVQRREVPARPGWMAAEDPRFLMRLSARGSLDFAPGVLPPVDVVFIDGDHGKQAVEHDTRLARAALRPGGLIIWHDYHGLPTVDVREVLEAQHAAGAPIEHVEDTWIAFEQV